jgi:hypothetical protein
MCSKPRSKSHMTGYYRESHWLSPRISRLFLGISSLRLLQAKTAIAPLDRVKILFQTSNADFKQYAGEPSGNHLYLFLDPSFRSAELGLQA